MDDFGKIMDEWDALSRKKGPAKRIKPREEEKQEAPNPMEQWLNRHSVEDKDSPEAGGGSEAPSRRELYAMAPQDRIDLHGLTIEEALETTGKFIKGSQKRGYTKVLIIHGKGYHSPGRRSVLKKEVRLFLERNPRVGEFGSADRTAGGEGATWVFLKKPSRPQ